MRNYKKYVMFIGPITNDHGQGRVTSTTFKILKNNCSVDFINTHIKNLNIFSKFLISFLIIVRIIILLIKLNFLEKKLLFILHRPEIF